METNRQRQEDFFKRTLKVGGQGLAGYAVMGIFAFSVAKFSPFFVERSMEVTEKLIVGGMEIIATSITQVRGILKAPFMKSEQEERNFVKHEHWRV